MVANCPQFKKLRVGYVLMAIPRPGHLGRTFHISGRHPFKTNACGRACYMASPVHQRRVEVSGGRLAGPSRAAVSSRWPTGRRTVRARGGRPSAELGPLGSDPSARRRPPARRDRRANRRHGSEPSTGGNLRTYTSLASPPTRPRNDFAAGGRQARRCRRDGHGDSYGYSSSRRH